MAKVGKLMKLKSALKKMNSFSKLKHCTSNNSIAAADDHDHDPTVRISQSAGLHRVYVGKSRREYHVTSQVIEHPAFQGLLSRSDGCDEMTVCCEVVLFQHLLWMLESTDPQLDSFDDLVAFYI
ncbi:hypothetical protein Ancab_029297 [Ancistrocladus abbreviatus]